MNSHNTETIEMIVPGMTCGHCEAAVKSEVAGVEGVSDVIVNLDNKLVTVTGTNLNRESLIEAVEEAGYDVD